MKVPLGKAYGQISEDDKLVRNAQVLYAENVDLGSNTDYITVSPKPQSLVLTSAKIQAIYFIERDIEKPIFGDDNKKIYLEGLEKYTANNDVRMFWSNSKYLLWLDYEENIFKILLSDINGDWTGKVTAGETNLENDTGKGFVVEGEGTAYIGYGTKLYEIDNDTGLLVNQYNFIYEKIVGMIDSRETIEIFQKDGKVFTWDKVSTHSSSYDLGIRIAIVIQSASQKYIIGEGAFYIMSGGSLTKVAGQYNSDVMQTNKFKFRELENSNIGFLKQVVYLGSDNIDPIKPDDDFVEFGKTCVLTMGTKKSGFQPGINKFLNTSSDGSKYTHIYGMTTKATNYSGYNDTLYITYKNENGLYGVDTVDLDSQNPMTSKEGLVIYPQFDGGNEKVEKKLVKIHLRAEFGNDKGKFYIYKVVGNKLVPFNGHRDKSHIKYTQGLGYKSLSIQENFFDITIAVVLKQDSDTPRNDGLKLYPPILEYEPIN